MPTFDLEAGFWNAGLTLVAGVDEAGRGAWAGPVAVGVVILPGETRDYPFRDSKTLTAPRREEYAARVKDVALAWAVEFAHACEVDEVGVLNATKAAALRGLSRLVPAPEALVTDYLKLDTPLPFVAPPRADGTSYTVAAASLLAKTARDEYMKRLEDVHPGYGFSAHKGYGALPHSLALERLGPSVEHRRTFAPIARLLQTRLL